MADNLPPLNFDELEAQGGQLDRLQARGRLAATAPSPEPIAPAPKVDISTLPNDAPTLADTIIDDPSVTAVVQNDTSLPLLEKLFRNWSTAVDIQNWDRILKRDELQQELAVIGNAELEGTATPAQLERAKQIEAGQRPEPEYGLIAGIIPAMVGMVPALARAARAGTVGLVAGATGGAAVGATGGAIAGAPIGGLGAAPGGLAGAIAGGAAGGVAGFGAGFTLGMVGDSAQVEQGLAFREYRALGASKEAARVGAQIVGFANGILTALPVQHVLKSLPGAQALLQGSGTRDIVRKLITSQSGIAALVRFAGHVTESGIGMALISNGMELVRELGMTTAGVEDPNSTWQQRHLAATTSGLQLGWGFGIAHAGPLLSKDLAETRQAADRVEMFRALGDLASKSELRERMPEAFKKYVNQVIDESGGPISEVKIPAEKLLELFQKEGISPKEIEARLPDVARQLASVDKATEIVIPIGDFVSEIAHLKSFPVIENDLRVGDQATAREAKEVQTLFRELEVKKEPKAVSLQGVYKDVHDQLIAAGQNETVATQNAALWSAFAKSRAQRLGIDPLEYYGKRKLALSVGADAVGKIEFEEARTFFKVTLSEKANLSTFLHESGRAFLEFLRLDAEEGHAQSMHDYALLHQWLGGVKGQALEKAHLEKFARGFETYLSMGKPPSGELKSAFRSFRNWLSLVYRNVKSIGVSLSSTAASVMDRMLATEEELAFAKRALKLESPLDAAVFENKTAWENYNKLYKEAIEEAEAKAEARTVAETRWSVLSERRKIRTEVEEAIRQDPAVNAFEILAGRERLDGGTIHPDLLKAKLSTDAVIEILGGDRKDLLRKLKEVVAPEGMDPEIAAPYLGFGSGEELVNALTFADKSHRRRAVQAEIDRRMALKYPGYAENPKWLEQHVLRELHSEKVGTVLVAELRAIERHVGGKSAPNVHELVRKHAASATESMTVAEINAGPGRFARAEAKAALESAEALKARDFELSRAAKLRGLLNHELWKSVAKAKDEAERIIGYLAKFDTFEVQKKLGRAGDEYVKAIDVIRGGLDLSSVSARKIAKQSPLEEFLRRIETDENALLAIPEEIRSQATLKPVGTLTLDTLRAVRDAVKNIEKQATLKNKLYDGVQKRNFQATTQGLAEHVTANLGQPFKEQAGEFQNPTWWGEKKDWLRKGYAQLKKIEFIARELDGGKTAGLAHELLFEPIARAEIAAEKKTNEIIPRLMAPFDKLTLAERFRYGKTVDFLGTRMRMSDVLSVACNLANDGNKNKLLKGYAYRGWTEQKVLKRLGELMTAKDCELVNHILEVTGSLWSDIAALSKRTVGVEPIKVKGAPFRIGENEITGGYFPIVYDRSRSYRAEQIAQKRDALFENNFLLPGVSKGFTEARTKFFAPIELSLSVVPNHLIEVIHYLTHYEAVRAVDRITNSVPVRSAITTALGQEVYKQFRPWLQAIAAKGVVQENITFADQVARHLRVGYTLQSLGGKISTAMLQTFGVYGSLKEIGPKYVGIGIQKFLAGLARGRPFADVEKRSPTARMSVENIQKQMMEDFKSSISVYAELGRMKGQITHFSMAMIYMVQKTVNAITWLGGYEKAIAENHPRPIEYADSVVRLSQMGESVKDMAAFQRGGETARSFSLMYSYFNVLFNQLTEKQPITRGAISKVANKAATWWWLVILPVVTEGMLGRYKDEEGDKDLAETAAQYSKEVGLYVTRTVPMLGIAAEVLSSNKEPRYASWINNMYKGLQVEGKLATGEFDLSNAEIRYMTESIGTLLHLPTSAVVNAYRYLDAYTNGSLEEPIQDLLFRSPSTWK